MDGEFFQGTQDVGFRGHRDTAAQGAREEEKRFPRENDSAASEPFEDHNRTPPFPARTSTTGHSSAV
jgi:hypothetical protein